MIHDIIQPLQPKADPDWGTLGDVRTQMRSGYPIEAWFHLRMELFVLSAVEVATDGDGTTKGPEYHLSVSKRRGGCTPERCMADEAKWMLEQFGLDGWEEDNHVPGGQVRNFWRPVAEPLIGKECACKKTEHLVVEGDFEHRPLEDAR